MKHLRRRVKVALKTDGIKAKKKKAWLKHKL